MMIFTLPVLLDNSAVRSDKLKFLGKWLKRPIASLPPPVSVSEVICKLPIPFCV